MGATKQAKKEKLVPRRELLLKLNEELPQARQDLANALGDFITELEGILEHIWGENFALNIWWEWHRGGPTVFIRLTGSVQDTLGGLDIDIDHVMDAGYTPLSIALQDKLDTLGMSWYDVRTFCYEYYMNEKELDRFLREFDKLMDSEVQPEAGEKAKSKAKKPMTRRELWMKINQRLSCAYDVIVDVCNELSRAGEEHPCPHLGRKLYLGCLVGLVQLQSGCVHKARPGWPKVCPADWKRALYP
jgi:hypothetical protein